MIGAVGPYLYVVQVDAGVAEAFELHTASLVVAHAADVLYAQAEFGGGDQRARYLAAGAEDLRFERNFSRISRKMRNNEQCVSGIETHAHQIEFRLSIHLTRLRIARAVGSSSCQMLRISEIWLSCGI